MLIEFEEQTAPLDGNELKCMRIIANGLLKRRGKFNAITAKKICAAMNQAIADGVYKDIPRDYRLTRITLPKIVNRLRADGTIPLLCATSSGYYIADNKKEAETYIKSLQGRIRSIRAVEWALLNQYSQKFGEYTHGNDTHTQGGSVQ